MYVNELVEQRDARMAADAERVDDEQEAPADCVRPVELGLPDLEHLRGRREARHVREEAEQEVGRVVELPAHRQLDEVAQRAVGHRDARAVRLVVPEQAGVVHEPVLLQQVGGVGTERERRRPVALRARVEGILDPADAPAHQLALLVDREFQDALVVIAVVADLAPEALDVVARAGMLVDDLPWHHERRRDPVPVQQFEDARDASAYVVIAARQRAWRQELERTAPQRLGVEVHRQRHGAAVAIFPEHHALLPSGTTRIIESPARRSARPGWPRRPHARRRAPSHPPRVRR